MLQNLFTKLADTANILLFSDDPDTRDLYNFAIFPSFHMPYFNGSIIFLDLDNFLYHQQNINAHPLLYYTGSMKDLDRSIISKENIYEI
ncbi:MAG: hypothetical protein ACO3UU_16655 [Minisyncoccia bacterium]